MDPNLETDIPQWIERMHRGGISERRQAVDYLSKLQPVPPVVVSAFVQSLNGSDSVSRTTAHYARHALERFGSVAVRPLLDALKDPIPAIRNWAARILGRLRLNPEDVVPALIDATRADRVDTKQAARSLSQFALGPLLLELDSFLTSRDADIRGKDADLLVELGGQSKAVLPKLLTALDYPDIQERVVKALGLIGPDAWPSVPGLRQILASISMDRNRYKATIKTLGSIGAGAHNAIPSLWQFLEDHCSDKDLSEAVIEALGCIGPGAVSTLQQILESHSANKDLCGLVVETLGHIGPDARSACPALLPLLQDGKLRRQTIHALGRIGPDARDAVPLLGPILWSEEVDLQREVVVALVAISSDPIYRHIETLLFSGDISSRQQAAEAVGTLGPHAEIAFPILVQALSDSDIHMAAAAVLGYCIGDGGSLGHIRPVAIKTLLSKLASEDEDLRAGVIETLVRVGQPAIPFLVEALNSEDICKEDEDMFYRRQATADTLAQIGGDAVPFLVNALRQGETKVRRAVANSLGQPGPCFPEAIQALVEALGDKDEEVRDAATKALVVAGPAAFLPLLVRSLDSDNDWVHLAAAETSGQAGTPVLVEALCHRSARIRWTAAKTLRRIGPPARAALRTLLNCLCDPSPRVQKAASQALVAICPGERSLRAIRALKCGDDSYRVRAAIFLGKIGHEAQSAVPSLIQALHNDKIVKVREAACRALHSIAPTSPEVIGNVILELGRVRAAFDVLVDIGAPVTSVLGEMIQDQDTVNWRLAAGVLGRIGTEASVSILARAWAVPDESVRIAVIEALARIGAGVKGVVRLLVNALKDSEDSVRDVAIRVVVRMGPDSIPDLVELLDDDDERTRETVARVLRDMKGMASEALPHLVRLLDDDRGHISVYAAVAIWNIFEVKRLLDVLLDDESILQEHTREDYSALRVLVHAVQRKENAREVRTYAAESLGRIGTEAKVITQDLVKICLDMDEPRCVRESVDLALKQINQG